GADHGAQSHDAAGAVEAHLDLVLDLTGVVGGHQALTTLLDPAHRSSEPERRQRDQDVFGVELAPRAEAAADIDLGETQSARGDTEDRGQDAAVDVDALRRAQEVELPAPGI